MNVVSVVLDCVAIVVVVVGGGGGGGVVVVVPLSLSTPKTLRVGIISTLLCPSIFLKSQSIAYERTSSADFKIVEPVCSCAANERNDYNINLKCIL